MATMNRRGFLGVLGAVMGGVVVGAGPGTQREAVTREAAGFEVGGEPMLGVVHRPGVAPKEARPGVVLVHDLVGEMGGPNGAFLELADLLARQGHVCLRFDRRGRGKSAGKLADLTVARELEDCRAALAFVRGLAGVQPRRAGVVGVGWGGVLAGVLAGTDDGICKTVLWDAAPGDGVEWPRVEGVGEGFYESVKGLRALSVFERTESPVLLAWGTKDAEVTEEKVLGVRAGLETTGINVDLLKVEGADRGFSDPRCRTELIAGTARWVAG